MEQVKAVIPNASFFFFYVVIDRSCWTSHLSNRTESHFGHHPFTQIRATTVCWRKCHVLERPSSSPSSAAEFGGISESKALAGGQNKVLNFQTSFIFLRLTKSGLRHKQCKRDEVWIFFCKICRCPFVQLETINVVLMTSFALWLNDIVELGVCTRLRWEFTANRQFHLGSQW